MNKNQIVTFLGYSFIHGVVDLCCAIVVFSSLRLNIFSADSVFFYIVTYNVIAFGLQAPFGVLVDRFQNPKESAWYGCSLILISFLFINYPSLAIILSALGNAFFHVGGGSISLNFNPTKATAPGIFVAPGAIGLMVGILIGKSGNNIFWPFELLLILSIIFINFAKIPKIIYQQKTIGTKVGNFNLAVLMLLLSVSIRSLYGLASAWKADVTLLIILTVGIAAGKAFGGIVADKYNWTKTAFCSLMISSLLLSLFKDFPLLAIIGAFLLQMTMPVTLTALSNIFKGRSATAFGLTTLALVAGAIPTYYTNIATHLNSNWLTFVIIIMSVSFLLVSLKILSNYFKKQLGINI